MRSLGLEIIRFTNHEVCEKGENVIMILEKMIKNKLRILTLQ